MTDRNRYFGEATQWAVDARVREARSARIAWIIAAIAAVVAILEAVALALLTPLKTVQPITLLVDRQTGFVQALDPQTPRRIQADAALTTSLLAQYVTAREAFDRATIANDYRHVAVWSSGPARARYLALMPASNPESPLQRYPSGTIVATRVKSVSALSPGVALVRFETQQQDRNGRSAPAQPWIAIIRYQYSSAPMSFENRLINPLGFQVTSYRRDAEAPGEAAAGAAGEGLERQHPAASERGAPPLPSASPADPRLPSRSVALRNVPLGSPLAPFAPARLMRETP